MRGRFSLDHNLYRISANAGACLGPKILLKLFVVMLHSSLAYIH
jgi:hypothetical protein